METERNSRRMRGGSRRGGAGRSSFCACGVRVMWEDRTGGQDRGPFVHLSLHSCSWCHLSPRDREGLREQVQAAPCLV